VRRLGGEVNEQCFMCEKELSGASWGMDDHGGITRLMCSEECHDKFEARMERKKKHYQSFHEQGFARVPIGGWMVGLWVYCLCDDMSLWRYHSEHRLEGWRLYEVLPAIPQGVLDES